MHARYCEHFAYTGLSIVYITQNLAGKNLLHVHEMANQGFVQGKRPDDVYGYEQKNQWCNKPVPAFDRSTRLTARESRFHVLFSTPSNEPRFT